MKKISLFLLCIPSLLIACPTCVGRIESDSPPFFSDEFYKPASDSMDELISESSKEPQNELEKVVE